MKYYENNGILYTSNAPITNVDFVEITKEEYELRLSKVKVEYTPPSTEEDEWNIGIDDATEQDYINALIELGVTFDE